MAQIKKKKFFDIELPIIGKETQLLAYDDSTLEGRTVKYDLTRILKGKSIDINFKIKKEDNKLIAYPVSLQLMPYFIRRMIRKGTNYIEDSFEVECNDSLVLIKPFLLTRRKVSRKVRKALREQTKIEIINYVSNKKAKDLFSEILENKLQKYLSLKLKKIYPLSLCEIRVLKIKKDLDKKNITKVVDSQIKEVTEKKKDEDISEVKEKKEKKVKKVKEKKEKE